MVNRADQAMDKAKRAGKISIKSDRNREEK